MCTSKKQAGNIPTLWNNQLGFCGGYTQYGAKPEYKRISRHSTN